MKEQKRSFTEQIADEGAYITQSAEVSDDERLYLTRRVKLQGEESGLWRDASADEKAQYDARMAERYPMPPEPEPEPVDPGFGVDAEMPEIVEPEIVDNPC